MKSLLFVSLLAAAAAAVMAVAAAAAGEAQLAEGLLVYILSIGEGIVICNENGNMGVFPNAAEVQLQCGDGNVISPGEFSLSWGPRISTIFPLSSLLIICNLVVDTPLERFCVLSKKSIFFIFFLNSNWNPFSDTFSYIIYPL